MLIRVGKLQFKPLPLTPSPTGEGEQVTFIFRVFS